MLRYSSLGRRCVRAPPCRSHLQGRGGARRCLATAVDVHQKDPAELDKITTLPNGVRVATENLRGPFSAIGVYVVAGSRYESKPLQGVSHIIDRLAFKSTRSRSADQMIELVESLGGNIQCGSSRESIMYQCATFNSAVPSALGVLAETIRDPLVTQQELEAQLATADYEITEIWSKPELILPELVHVAAYKDNTLGNPLLCPRERLAEIDRPTIEAYMKSFYKPENIVVALVGTEHDEAVRLVERYFGDMSSSPGVALPRPDAIHAASGTAATAKLSPGAVSPPSALAGVASESAKLLSKIPLFKNLSTSATKAATVSPLYGPSLDISPPDMSTASHYTGGFLKLPPTPPPANPALPQLSHIHIAFEALPITSPDIYALATLQTLLGGGGSFSAGGPGKGMYSRLFTNVLNQFNWVENCVAFNHSYTDSGLFGISASCWPTQTSSMIKIICRELRALTLTKGPNALNDVEVQRAKNQLRSSLLMNLESRLIELEDLGRQIQVHGHRVGVTEMCRKIDNVTVQDLRRVASSIFSGAVQNSGNGTGQPTIVLQEAETDNYAKTELHASHVYEQIEAWGLGRKER